MKLQKALIAAALLASATTMAAPMLPTLPQQPMLPATQQALAAPQVNAKAAVLMDFATGKILAAQNEHEHLAPASLTKIMSAYVVYSAIHDGRLKPNQVVPISVNAWRTGGSKMFVDPNIPVTVDELLHGMIIQSGNDATVALAEAVAGNEQTFVQMMNMVAQRLGMKDSHFVTVNGLPDPNHYSSAYDLAILTRHLIMDFPQYYKYEHELSYTYHGIKQGNRNVLLPAPGNRYGYPGADGVKTGHTEDAGYCLVGSAVRHGMRLISVVMGTDSGIARATESEKLLNYGFQMFEDKKAIRDGEAFGSVPVIKGKDSKVVAVTNQDVFMTLPRGAAGNLQTQAVLQPKLMAPVKAGQQIGLLKVSVNGTPAGEYPLVAQKPVAEAGWLGRLWYWIKSLLHLL